MHKKTSGRRYSGTYNSRHIGIRLKIGNQGRNPSTNPYRLILLDKNNNIVKIVILGRWVPLVINYCVENIPLDKRLFKN